MENYNNILKISKIKKLMTTGKHEDAYQLAATIDVRKVKNVIDMAIIADAFAQNKKYEQARVLYHKIYEKTRSKRALSELVHMSIKLKDITEAEFYLDQIETLTPDDSNRLVFRFQLDKLKQCTSEELIATLEKLKHEDYMEHWAYELAKLYHKTGDKDNCIKECNDIILWFGEGEYVEWAKVLKGHHMGEIDVAQMQIRQDEISLAEEVRKVIGSQDENEEQNTSYDSEDFFTGYANVEEVIPGSVFDKADYSFAAHSMDEPVSTDSFSTDKTFNIDETFHINKQANANEAMITEESIHAEEPTNIEELISSEEPIYSEELINPDELINPEEVMYLEEPVCIAEFEPVTDSFVSVPVENEIEKFEDTDKETEDSDDFKLPSFVEEAASEDTPINEISVKDMTVVDMNRSRVFEHQLDSNGRLCRLMREAELSLEDVFGNYARMDNVRKQLIRTLDVIFDTHKKNINLIITGGDLCGKTTLAKRLARLIHQFGELKTVRVAIISADKLNQMDITKKQQQLSDCCLIIEHAGKLKKHTVDDLLSMNPVFSGHTAVILEDSRNNINKLLRDNQGVNSIYSNRIHLPNEYKADELLGFAYDYLLDRDYELTVDADAVLKDFIKQIAQEKKQDKIDVLYDYIKKVIEKAEKRTAKSLLELAASGKYAESDIMILRLEDFIV